MLTLFIVTSSPVPESAGKFALPAIARHQRSHHNWNDGAMRWWNNAY